MVKLKPPADVTEIEGAKKDVSLKISHLYDNG